MCTLPNRYKLIKLLKWKGLLSSPYFFVLKVLCSVVHLVHCVNKYCLNENDFLIIFVDIPF